MSPSESNKNHVLRRVLLLIAEALIVVYVTLDALVTPLFRPLVRWFAKLRFVIHLQEIVARLPPYGILTLLAIPFAIAEPAKVYAVFLFATGHETMGLIIFVGAYFISIVVMERIYSTGRDKLRTITWFAKLMDFLFAFRDRLIAWAKATPVWIFTARIKQRAGAMIKQLRLRFGLG
ncbi:MAG: hypothetical protein WDN46_21280 [Methylocella sp.]